jgi:pyruvate kinase
VSQSRQPTNTRIVCTLGPASESQDVLRAMIVAGMGFARLNFSHGTYDDHRRRADLVRQLAETLGQPVEVIQDLQGPKIRTVNVPLTALPQGQTVVLGPPDQEGAIPISLPEILETVQAGDPIYIDDGAIELEAVTRSGAGWTCHVIVGGTIEGNQGVVFPQSVLPLPPLNERDLEDVAVGRQLGVEWVALSFVQRASDVTELRRHIAPGAQVISKIETPAALSDLNRIVAASDCVMIARGDLGVAIPRARVPIVQKDVIRTCGQQGTLSIVATEMLLSMVQHHHPTRAEVADVATAVLDGASAVMLSEETAIGRYPALAVAEMQEIIETVEVSPYYQWGRPASPDPGGNPGESGGAG